MFSVDQYEAARTAAVIAGRSSRGTVVLTGGDRRSFLHALVTNDIASLVPGKGTYAAYLTPQGRMICDMRVVETGAGLLLGVGHDVAAPLAERLDTLIFSEDVQVRNATSDFDELGVYGPAAARLIEAASGIPAATLTSEYDAAISPFVVVRDDTYGVPGFDVYVAPSEAGTLRRKLLAAGAVAAAAETLESLRVEAGRPRFGVDMFADTIPLEAGIEDRAISFTKGCYVGQEVIVRVTHRGHGRVARRLVRLAVHGPLPAPQDAVLAGVRQVGEITSAAESPKAGGPLAFAYVQREFAAPGTELTVGHSKAIVYQPMD
jgi:folate-binding protein YgfZ